MYSTTNLNAAQLWHERIGRFISSAGSPASLKAAYPSYKDKKPSKGNAADAGSDAEEASSGKRVLNRLGICGASFVMIDAKTAILLDRIDLNRIEAKTSCANFLYGETVHKVENGAKAQINWALETARVYPMLLVRPSIADCVKSLRISHTEDQVVVCSANDSFSFDPKKVRVARDYILERGLQKKWREAARLRETIGNGEHVGGNRENKLLADHAAMLELFPLSVWLPEVGSGDQQALADALAEKPSPDLSKLAQASSLLAKPR